MCREAARGRLPERSLRVELDDQLLLHGHVDLCALGQLVHEDPQVRLHDLQPAGDRPVAEGLLGHDERQRVQRLRLHVDDVELRHLEAGHVDPLAVDGEVAVADELPGLPPGAGQARAVDDVVQPRLEQLQQRLTGLALGARGLLVVAAELPLQHAVGIAGLLLLLELKQVLALLDAAAAVLAGRVGTALEGAVAADEVDLETTRLAGRGAGVTSHVSLLLPALDPAPLRRPAAVVRLRGDVLDGADLETGRLQRPDRGLPAGAGALDEHVDLAHAVLGGLAGGVLGSHLRRERRGLTRALEADVAAGRPADHVAVRVGDRDDGVVERALDVRVAVRDVLLFLAPDLLYAGALTGLGWHCFRMLLLARGLGGGRHLRGRLDGRRGGRLDGRLLARRLGGRLPAGPQTSVVVAADRAGVAVEVTKRCRTGVAGRDLEGDELTVASALCDDRYDRAHFFPAFFLPATVFLGPLRVRALVLVR